MKWWTTATEGHWRMAHLLVHRDRLGALLFTSAPPVLLMPHDTVYRHVQRLCATACGTACPARFVLLSDLLLCTCSEEGGGKRLKTYIYISTHVSFTLEYTLPQNHPNPANAITFEYDAVTVIFHTRFPVDRQKPANRNQV